MAKAAEPTGLPGTGVDGWLGRTRGLCVDCRARRFRQVGGRALIVGGNDEVVLDLNRRTQARLRCENRLAVTPGATRLFGEPGALETAADLATPWFTEHLNPDT